MKLKQSGLQTTTALHASDYCSVLNLLFVCTSNEIVVRRVIHYSFALHTTIALERLTILGCCSTYG